MATFLKADFEKAVEKATSGYLTSAQQGTVTQAIWDEAKKGKTGKSPVDAFKTAVGGFITDPGTVRKLTAAFPGALTAARDERTAAKSGAPDPATEKAAKLRDLVNQATEAWEATKKFADAAEKAAKAAEADATAAEEAATKVEELRPGTSMATDARDAATNARDAATNAMREFKDESAPPPRMDAESQLVGARAALVDAESVLVGNGNVIDAEKAVSEAQAAQRFCRWPAESAAAHAKTAAEEKAKATGILDKIKAEDAEKEKAKAEKKTKLEQRKAKADKAKAEKARKAQEAKEKSFTHQQLLPRLPTFVALIVAIVIAGILALAGAVPPVAFWMTLAIAAFIAVWATLQKPPAGLRGAVILAALATVLLVISLAGVHIPGADGGGHSKAAPAATATATESPCKTGWFNDPCAAPTKAP